MTGMDALTVYAILAWVIFILCPLYAIWGTAVLIRRWTARRRRNREWAAGLARRVRERRTCQCQGCGDLDYLDWLEGEFSAEGSELP